MSYISGLVSVVIPTYKRSEMLYRAIESVLNQTYKNVECIVVNDNTPGDEFSMVLYKTLDKYNNDNRFKFIEQKEHINGAAARNAGIRVAKGEYIAFLDDDDFWDINKLEVQVKEFEQLPSEWGAVSCLMRFYRNGEIYAANLPYKDGNIYYDVLTRDISMGTGSLIIRRVCLDRTGYFDENLRRFQDPQLFSFLTEKYKVKLIKRYLHNRDVDDAQNRPSLEIITKYQEDFYKSISPLLGKLSRKKVKILKIIYDFDKMPLYWRGGELKQALLCVLKVIRYPETIRLAFKRVWGRFGERAFFKHRLLKYT